MRNLSLWILACSACVSTASEPQAPREERAIYSAASDASLGDMDNESEAGIVNLDAHSSFLEIETQELTEEGEEADHSGITEEVIDDGYDDEEDPTRESVTWQSLPPHPLASLTTQELLALVREDMASLGPMSLGTIRGGALINGVQMPESEHWTLRQPNAAWGTQETLDAIDHCIQRVAEEYEHTPKLVIGHISRKRGGRFPPHVSHQNGRDVDIGYYYNSGEPWYTYTTNKNLDHARTWSLLRCFVTDTDVELILSDQHLIATLRDYAISIGEDRHWVHQVMGGKTATMRPLVRHARGHATHLHVRFYSPIARETGRLMYRILVQSKVINPPPIYIYHRARKGHTLAYMARRYRVHQRDIKRANQLRGSLIREGHTYKIPHHRRVAKIEAPLPVKVPNRRLPPKNHKARKGEFSRQKANASP